MSICSDIIQLGIECMLLALMVEYGHILIRSRIINLVILTLKLVTMLLYAANTKEEEELGVIKTGSKCI